MVNLKGSVWLNNIACKDESPKIFSSFDPEVIAVAKTICARCPETKMCLLTYGDTSLIAGGTTRYERMRMTWHRVEDINDSNW